MYDFLIVGAGLTGAVLAFNWMFLFEAYRHTTVATATLCYYFEPTILLLLSPLLFKEKLTGRKLLCAGLAILGMVFVSGAAEGGGIPPEARTIQRKTVILCGKRSF